MKICEEGAGVCVCVCVVLWGSGGESRLVKQVQFGAGRRLGSYRRLLLDHLHL